MLIHVLAILMILVRRFLSLITVLRCCYKIQSRLGADEFLHLVIALLNSLFEKGGHSYFFLMETYSKSQA